VPVNLALAKLLLVKVAPMTLQSMTFSASVQAGANVSAGADAST
jgi:invasion protein IalB